MGSPLTFLLLLALFTWVGGVEVGGRAVSQSLVVALLGDSRATNHLSGFSGLHEQL